MIEIYILLSTGIFVGTLVGLFGIGWGLIIVPVISYILITVHGYSFDEALIRAIATSLASIVLSSSIAIISNHFNHNINWKIVSKFAPGVLIGSILIGFCLQQLPTNFIRTVFILYTLIAAYKILCPAVTNKISTLPSFFLTNFIGAGFGFLSGLVGIGGGTLFVPYMTSRGIKIKSAIGITSCLSLIIGFSSSTALFFSWQYSPILQHSPMIGAVYLPAIIFLTLPSLIFVKLSSDWLQKICDKKIQRAFAYLLILIGLIMLFMN